MAIKSSESQQQPTSRNQNNITRTLQAQKLLKLQKNLIGLNNNNNSKLGSRKTHFLETHECGIMYSSCNVLTPLHLLIVL